MRLDEKSLGRVARNVLDFLRDEKIESIQDMRKTVNKMKSYDYLKEHLSVQIKPSRTGTDAYVLSYIIDNGGIPLELWVNESAASIIAKADVLLPDYLPFGRDPYDNIAQIKEFRSPDMPALKSELEKLAEKAT